MSHSQQSLSGAARSLPPLQPVPGTASESHQSATSPTSQSQMASHNHSSPAESSIFERNVQESTVPNEISSAIPSHIMTEDLIPPALEASSLAITDDHLKPDDVEIVTHVAHQPAAASMADTASLAPQSEVQLPLVTQDSHSETMPGSFPESEIEESGPTYGDIDPNDVRRLNFISFADVVHAEHVEHEKEVLHQMPLSASSFASGRAQSNRSPSPALSPVSLGHSFSQDLTTPPTTAGGLTSASGLDLSPPLSQPGSPPAGKHSHQHGDLVLETMSQALRKTASGDLTAHRNPPTSAIGTDE